MVALGILIVAIFAVFSMITRAVSLNRVVSQQYVATYLAAEGLELVKNITDSNRLVCSTAWNEGASPDGTYELTYTDDTLMRRVSMPTNKLRINTNGFYQYESGEPTPFRRAVTIETINDDKEIRVTAWVTWEGRGGSKSDVKLEDHFFKWRPDPAGC